jgi:hypothetical protein
MRIRKMLLALVVVLVTAGVSYLQRSPADYRMRAGDAEPLHEAMEQLTDVIVYDIFSPPQASRTYAYPSIAAYEALRHDHPGHRTLAGQVNGLAPVPAPEPGAELYLPLAGVHAFMTVGRALTFSQERMDSLRADMHQRARDMGIPAEVFRRSVAYGDRVAEQILAWAREDHYVQTRSYPNEEVLRDTRAVLRRNAPA